MNVVGLDLSLSGTGICTSGGAHVYSSKQRGMARVDDILCHLIGTISDADLVVVEGYAMGTGRQAGSYSIGELGGVVRHCMHIKRVPTVDVPPATLKKFATSKGNAGKPDMLAAAIRHGYDGPNDDNCVDAWWLYQLGLYAVGRSAGFVACTEYRDEASGKIDWPHREPEVA